MTTLPLTSGAYMSPSIVAGAQRCVNLYPEAPPTETQPPMPVTHRLAPGLRLLGTAPNAPQPIRAVFQASTGAIYVVSGPLIYAISVNATTKAWIWTLTGALGTSFASFTATSTAASTTIKVSTTSGLTVGQYVSFPGAFSTVRTITAVNSTLKTITVSGAASGVSATLGTLYAYVGLSTATTPVAMRDNGLTVLIGDGTANLYTIDLTSGAFAQVISTAIYGATSIDYLDTFFILNRPGTTQFYISGSLATTFDPLDIAGKVSSPDLLQAVIVMHKEIWLVGTWTTEVWFNSGAADFTFQELPGAFMEHGTVAPYSVAKHDLNVFFLSGDREGRGIVVLGNGYNLTRISTHAIEKDFQSYSSITDAVGFTYQIEGHIFYHLWFPTADKSWVFDLQTKQWHERVWTDSNGAEHAHRASCAKVINTDVVVGDRQNGKVYALDPATYTDNGDAILRLRSFPTISRENVRVTYAQLIADMQVGTTSSAATIPEPVVSLRWSDTRGASWGNRIDQSMGAAGEYETSVQFQRLGMGRNRVFELSWTASSLTGLNGAYVNMVPHRS